MKTISKLQSGIHFQAPDSRWVMKITPARKIEVNEDVEVSEAAMTLIGIVNDMTKPKKWQGLSDDEIGSVVDDALRDWEGSEAKYYGDVYAHIAHAIEAKLKEKNEK